jgi:CheY-like chemotaxis protein
VVHAYPAQAIEAILAEPPSAVLTDLNMPEITGIELIRQLRERYPRNELPIIMVTTQQSAEDDREALDAGADAVIRKPFTPDDLSRALAAAGVHP